MDVYVEEDRTKPLNWDFSKDQQQNIEAEIYTNFSNNLKSCDT